MHGICDDVLLIQYIDFTRTSHATVTYTYTNNVENYLFLDE
jgi:hypothetical protein